MNFTKHNALHVRRRMKKLLVAHRKLETFVSMETSRYQNPYNSKSNLKNKRSNQEYHRDCLTHKPRMFKLASVLQDVSLSLNAPILPAMVEP